MTLKRVWKERKASAGSLESAPPTTYDGISPTTFVEVSSTTTCTYLWTNGSGSVLKTLIHQEMSLNRFLKTEMRPNTRVFTDWFSVSEKFFFSLAMLFDLFQLIMQGALHLSLKRFPYNT